MCNGNQSRDKIFNFFRHRGLFVFLFTFQLLFNHIFATWQIRIKKHVVTAYKKKKKSIQHPVLLYDLFNSICNYSMYLFENIVQAVCDEKK